MPEKKSKRNSRKLLALSAAVGAVAAAASQSNAALIVYEPFAGYGSTIGNGTATQATAVATGATVGFSGNWAGGGPAANSTANLTYSTLPTTGASFQPGAGTRLTENFTSAQSGTLYASFLIKGSGNSGGDANGIIINGTTSNLFVGFNQGFSGGETGFGIGTLTAGTSYSPLAAGSYTNYANINNEATHYVVLQINNGTSVNMWIDPTVANVAAGTPGASFTKSGISLGSLTGFGFEGVGVRPLIDEFRLGTTFADVAGVVGPTAKTWTGTISNSWDTLGTNNWSPSAFANDDVVAFSDTGTNTNIDVQAGGVSQAGMTFSNTTAKDYSIGGGSIGGTGGVTKTGNGTVSFTGTNAFTGAVAINNGTLVANSIADGGSNSALGAGTSVTIGSATAGKLIYTGANASSNRSIAVGAAGGTVETASSLTLSGVVSGGTLTLSGGGTLTVSNASNTYSSLSIANGTVSANSTGALGGSGTIAIGSASNAGRLQYTGANASIGRSVTLGAAGGTIETTNALSASGVVSGGTLTKAGAGTLTLSSANTHSGGTIINEGAVSIGNANSLGTGAVTLNGANTKLQLKPVAGVNVSGFSGFNLVQGQGGSAPTVASNILSITQTAANHNNNAAWRTTAVPYGDGFTASFTYQLPSNGAGINGAAFVLTNAAVAGVGAAGVVGGFGGSYGYTPGGQERVAVIPSAAFVWDSTSQSIVRAGFSSGGVATLSGTTTNTNAGGGPVNISSGNLIDFVISSSGGASNTLDWSVHDQVTGNTRTGTVTLGNTLSNLLGNGGNAFVGFTGATQATALQQTIRNFSYTTGVSGVFNVANNVIVAADSTIDISYGAGATLGTLSIGSNALSFTNELGGGATLTVGATTATGNATFAPATGVAVTMGALSDNGSAKTIGFSGAGTGSVTLNTAAASVVDGTAFNVSSGTLNSNHANALGSQAAVNLGTGATVNVGASQTFGALGDVGSPAVDAGTLALGSNTLTVGNTNNLSGNYSGVISGTGNLVKEGAGTQVMNGTGNYTGTTTVNAGTLRWNGTLTSGGGGITVNSGGTLGGTGTINRNVSGSGTVAPGNSIGTLTIGGDYHITGTHDFEIARGAGPVYTNDNINGIAALTYDGTLKISLGSGSQPIGSFNAGDNWDLFDFASHSGSFANNGVFGTAGDGTNLPTLTGGKTWAFDYTTGVLSIEGAGGGQPGFYTLAVTPATGGVLLNGNKSITSTVSNSGTGADDDINYTGLTATSGANGSIAGGSSAGGPLAQGQSGNQSLTFTGTGYSAGVTVTPAATVTNDSDGNPATQDSATDATYVVGLATAASNNNRDSFGTALTGEVAANSDYSGLESKAAFQTGSAGAGILGSVATIAMGRNSTGPTETVSMAWRTRNIGGDGPGSEAEVYPGQTPPFLSVPANLASDIVRLTGMENQGDRSAGAANEFGRRFESDAYALELSYDGIAGEADAAISGNIFMVWLDPDYDNATDGTTADNGIIGNDDDRWVLATAGNFGQGSSFALDPAAYTNVQSSWEDFALLNGITEANIGDWVGAWGVDTTDWVDGAGQTHDGRVWAVLNHNSDFSVVPEPGSLGLIGIAGGALLGRRGRRNKRAK